MVTESNENKAFSGRTGQMIDQRVFGDGNVLKTDARGLATRISQKLTKGSKNILRTLFNRAENSTNTEIVKNGTELPL